MQAFRFLRAPVLVLASLVVLATTALADEVRVMISGGYAQSYEELSPAFEQATKHHLQTLRGPSMGTTVNAIPVRLARGEPADVVIMVGYALDDLIAKGRVQAASKVELVRSPIGIAVKAGARKPDISTVEALRQTLLDAKSVAYSDSASGVYVGNELFRKLGIADQMKDKARMIPATPVGEIVAHGEAEIGFQQISELKAVQGIDMVGPLPGSAQMITVFSAGITTNSQSPAAAQALLKFLQSPEALAVVRKNGLTPISDAP